MQPGAVFAGRFTVASVAGSGGMGTVYRARDGASGAEVALKVLDSTSDSARFLREANALASLDHPAIVRYIAHGVADGEQWIAMEWLEGTSLGEGIRHRRPTIAETIALGIRVSAGLAVAHRLGIVHRDMKPSNVFLPGGSFEQAKVVDFGIARFADGGDTVTTTGSALGTPGYMAPEQARGTKAIDARADVFSLGCVIYCCLTGRGPFAADEPLAAMLRLALEEPSRPSELCEGIPQALDELVVRMLEKAPPHRPSDGQAVHDALVALRDRPGEVVAGLAPRTRALVGATSLVLVRAGRALSNDEPSELERREHDLRGKAERFGVELDFLPDRSMYLVASAREPAPQVAGRVARAALMLDSLLAPDFAMAMVTAWDVQSGDPTHEVIDRAIGLLAPGSRRGIALDPASASLLESKFTVTEDARGKRLVGEAETSSRPGARASALPASTTAAPPATAPRGRGMLAMTAATALIAVVALLVVVWVIVRSGSKPSAAAGGTNARSFAAATATPTPGANGPAAPAAPGAPAGNALNLPECREYLRQLECIYRTTPQRDREKYMNLARQDTRSQDAAYCRKHLGMNAKVARQMGCR